MTATKIKKQVDDFLPMLTAKQQVLVLEMIKSLLNVDNDSKRISRRQYNKELDAAVDQALALVHMSEFKDRPPHHLSFGQRRRVAVATVLAMKPEILVLDEPSSNLDPASRRELANILRELKITTLMVTHDIPYAYELCERSIILSGGIVVADGDTKTILSDSKLLRENRLELPVGFSL